MCVSDQSTVRFVPYEKMSKREKREIDIRKRQGWDGLNPCTKKIPSARIYNRKKKYDID